METKYLATLRNPMNSDSPAYLATIDDHRRIWGQYHKGYGCSFYIINGDIITDLHLTEEATIALHLVLEGLYKKISQSSIQVKSPKKKTPVVTKKAGNKRTTKKRPSLAKKSK